MYLVQVQSSLSPEDNRIALHAGCTFDEVFQINRIFIVLLKHEITDDPLSTKDSKTMCYTHTITTLK